MADINAGSESFQEYCARTGLNFQCRRVELFFDDESWRRAKEWLCDSRLVGQAGTLALANRQSFEIIVEDHDGRTPEFLEACDPTTGKVIELSIAGQKLIFSAGGQKYPFSLESDGCVSTEALDDPRMSSKRACVRLKLTVEGASLGANLEEIISTGRALGLRLIPRQPGQ